MPTNGSSHVVIALLILTLTCETISAAQPNDTPAHARPFFMPAEERARIRQSIATQEWAKADYARIQASARKGDGFLAAFLHALDGDPVYAPIAQKWLLGKFGADSGTTRRARRALDNYRRKAQLAGMEGSWQEIGAQVCAGGLNRGRRGSGTAPKRRLKRLA